MIHNRDPPCNTRMQKKSTAHVKDPASPCPKLGGLWAHLTKITQDALKVSESSICLYRVPGEIKRMEVELEPQVSPEEIMSWEMELGCESWTSFASGCSSTAVQRTLSL